MSKESVLLLLSCSVKCVVYSTCSVAAKLFCKSVVYSMFSVAADLFYKVCCF